MLCKRYKLTETGMARVQCQGNSCNAFLSEADSPDGSCNYHDAVTSETSGNDERMDGNGVVSSAIDNANSGGKTTAGNGPLKKGPWTSSEDAILVDYVAKHGEGNWNVVQKHSGLARCGKSCRLRWANHLRPNLKKGAFTPEEERRIIELHAKIGNKWARMANELPGRTDNEIKNYWNTRIKRQQRAGQPIYPPDICLEAVTDDQQSDSNNTFSSCDMHHIGFIPDGNFEIPPVEFKNLELNKPIYRPPMPDIPTANLFVDGFNSSNLKRPLHAAGQPSSKRLRGSEMLLPCLEGSIGNTFISDNQFNTSIQVGLPCSSSGSPYHHNSISNTVGSHGNPSSERPDWAMKQELPSLQTQMGSWCSPLPSSPLPSFESVESLIQTPPAEHNQPCNPSPKQNSSLLDAFLYESEPYKNSPSNGYLHGSYPSDVMPPNAAYELCETNWEAYDDELSPLGHSSSSIFCESTLMSGNSFEEPLAFPAANQMIFSRPDFLHASSCDVDHSQKDVVGMFIVDDYRQEIDTSAIASFHGHGCDVNPWNAMPHR